MNTTAESTYEIMLQNYNFLFEDELLKEMSEKGKQRSFRAGDMIIDIGEKMEFVPLLLTGSIKIIREDENGDELLLYYLERGDTCAMSLNCCMNFKVSNIKAITEQDAEMLFFPANVIEEWMIQYKSWRQYIFESYQIRLNELLEAIDTVAFHNMDERILKYLKDKAMVRGDTIISNTHQEIAQDLNTSRVVVSRILKQLSLKDKIKMSRNKIELLNL